MQSWKHSNLKYACERSCLTDPEHSPSLEVRLDQMVLKSVFYVCLLV